MKGSSVQLKGAHKCQPPVRQMICKIQTRIQGGKNGTGGGKDSTGGGKDGTAGGKDGTAGGVGAWGDRNGGVSRGEAGGRGGGGLWRFDDTKGEAMKRTCRHRRRFAPRCPGR